MLKINLALALVSGLWAQGDLLEKAPPDVEEALRARITGFYQAHVDKKFRQADAFVAEDTKDFYYESNKPAYLSFNIGKITYSENFTKAKAIINCKMRVPMPGFTEPIMAPIPSTWKLENGQWYWYVDQTRGRETPFGTMKSAGAATDGGSLPSLASGPSIESLWKSVRADKSGVQLSAKSASTEQVTIASKLPGIISLSLEVPKTPGLVVELDRTELKVGEEAKVTFRFEPQEKPLTRLVAVRVRVSPTNQVIPITVAIQ